MKFNIYTRFGLRFLLVILSVGGVYAYQIYKPKLSVDELKSMTQIYQTGEEPNHRQAAALKIIESTSDKTQISKAVWLDSGMTEQVYNILWEEGTERPGSSSLNQEKRAGKYFTKGCGLEVFSSEHKYESGTGWPSFYDVIDPANVVLKDDYSWLGIKRTEVLSQCGEHLGHVFEDGPEPTGLRYCMNGAALEFVPDEI